MPLSFRWFNDAKCYDVSQEELRESGRTSPTHLRCIRPGGLSGNACEGLKRSGRSSA
jgi:hypothetical protein